MSYRLVRYCFFFVFVVIMVYVNAIGDLVLIFFLFPLLVIIGLLFAFSWRCNKCRAPIDAHASIWTVPSHSYTTHCIVCGRDKSDTYPFSYLVSPEDWDGSYQDEGGGPQPNPDGNWKGAMWYPAPRRKKD